MTNETLVALEMLTENERLLKPEPFEVMLEKIVVRLLDPNNDMRSSTNRANRAIVEARIIYKLILATQGRR